MTAIRTSISGLGGSYGHGERSDQASRLRALVEAYRVIGHGEPQTHASTPPVDARRRCPVVTVTSGKGGVGKTNLCVNLAVVFAKRGLRVTLVDADLGLANADVLLGMTPTVRLEAALESRGGSRTLGSIAIPGPQGIRLVPGSVGLPKFAELNQAQRDDLVEQLVGLEVDSDVILIDTGAGIGPSVLSFVAAADMAVVVATPEPTSMADAYAMVKAVRSRRRQGSKLGLVVNMAESEGEGEWAAGRIGAVADRFLGSAPEKLGTVCRDGGIPAAVRSRRPFTLSDPQGKPAQDVAAIAARISDLVGLGMPVAEVEPVGFWVRLKAIFMAR